MWKHRIALLTT
ncbi:hypothetical protein BSR59_22435 [Vibrio parahaemolyticus]|nr:hypothetical protein BSR59_22435 [Vibrio parahaemolyticus]OOQ73423.1 hypothetical protein BSR63_18110 [Vibrio parahaemolyticus]